MPVGRGADAAYWWDTKTGSFVTQHLLHDRRCRRGCGLSTIASRADAHAGRGVDWPCRPARRCCKQLPTKRGAHALRSGLRQPVRQRAAARLRQRARSPRSGSAQRNATDLLSVSFSSNDSVGHTFGPDSPQVRDIAIRTDRAIGQLLDHVDKTSACSTRSSRSPPITASRRCRNRCASAALPGGRMTNKELFGPIEQALDDAVRRRQMADGHGGIVAVSELRAHREAAARSRPKCAASPPRPR